jgi:hypothetical protein
VLIGGYSVSDERIPLLKGEGAEHGLIVPGEGEETAPLLYPSPAAHLAMGDTLSLQERD